jgi:hypothetical protein
MATSRVTGVADTVKVLSKLNKEIVNTARKDLRTGAQPVANAIKSNIPTEAPLRGMIHNGRTRWQPAGITAKVKTNFSKKAQRNETSLVSIVVGAKGKNATGAASFQIADMAGRKNSSGRSGAIKPYAYKGGTRTHRNNGQGRAMINKLNSIARASRYVYPTAEREMPYIINQVEGTIKGLSTSLNNELKRVR